MSLITTAELPRYLHSYPDGAPSMPLSHMSNEDIDMAISMILRKGGNIADVPKSQYGRRVLVDTFMRLERQCPVE